MLPSLLQVAHAAFAAAPSDRAAVEALLEALDAARQQPIESGLGGGGGVRVSPPVALAIPRVQILAAHLPDAMRVAAVQWEAEGEGRAEDGADADRPSISVVSESEKEGGSEREDSDVCGSK